MIADALGARDRVLLATGERFPDALTAGAAASDEGVVLLTPRERPHPGIDAYLADAPKASAHAVGGPAARAYPEAEALAGVDRVETAVRVAERFRPSPSHVGLARADDFADAVTGEAHIAELAGPIPDSRIAPSL